MPLDSIFHTVSNTEMHKNCISLYLQSYIVTNSLRKNIIGEKKSYSITLLLLSYFGDNLEIISEPSDHKNLASSCKNETLSRQIKSSMSSFFRTLYCL